MSDGQKRRLVDRIIDPSYLEGLSDRSVDELRSMREEAREAETEMSFERRLCQARIDIMTAELDRRAGKGEEDLVARLPAILATEGGGTSEGSLPSRAPTVGVPRNADVPRRRVEEVVGEQTLARLTSLPSEEIESVISSLREHEKVVSSKRKAVQTTMDRIQTEVVRRYKTGEAGPAAVGDAS